MDETDIASPNPTAADIIQMKVTDLKAELTSRGLPANGRKDELAARLINAANGDGTEATYTSENVDNDAGEATFNTEDVNNTQPLIDNDVAKIREELQNFKNFVTDEIITLRDFTRTIFERVENASATTQASDMLTRVLMERLEHQLKESQEKTKIIDQLLCHLTNQTNNTDKTKETQPSNDNPWKTISKTKATRDNKSCDNTNAEIATKNRFLPLQYVNNSVDECSSSCIHTESNIVDVYSLNKENKHVHPNNKSQVRPEVVITEKHVVNNFKPIRPRTNSYSATVKRGRNVLIYSDSMLQRIRRNEFSNLIQNGRASFECFPGKKPVFMSHVVTPLLVEKSYETVAINLGQINL